jgi:nucleolar MIF4G domain-containing protein 1
MLIRSLPLLDLFEGFEDLESAAFGTSSKVRSRPVTFSHLRSASHCQKYDQMLREEEDDDSEVGDQLEFDEDEDISGGSAFGEDGISDDELLNPSDDDDHSEMGEIGSEGSGDDEGVLELSDFDSDDDEKGSLDDVKGQGKTGRFASEEAGSPASAEPTIPTTLTAGRYVPPHLRKAAETAPPTPLPSSTMDAPPEDPRLRRQIMGQLNKLSTTNMPVILDALAALYSSHPRALVSITLTSLLLEIISSRDNLGEQLVITYAALVAALARTIGVEFPAGVIAKSVGIFDEALAKNVAARKEGVDLDGGEGFEGRPGSKECENIVAFVAELYNFQVVACLLIYDLVKLFIDSGLEELEVELLVKIVKRE